jgi:hypothetical protein
MRAMSTLHATPTTPKPGRMPGTEGGRRWLLACGVAYGVVYILADDAIAASVYDGYSRLDQAVSELSAVGAPTRVFLMLMLPVFSALMVAFGIGVWRSAYGSRALRVTGAILVAFGVTGVLWLGFPMSRREDIAAATSTTVNDVGHLVLSGLTVVLIVGMYAAAAVHFGLWFRVYTAVTLVVTLLFSGVLTAAQSAKIPDGDPTPLLGFYERVGMGAWMLWLAVLACLLLRERQRG